MFCGLQPKQAAHLLASIIKGLRRDSNTLNGSLALLLLLLCVFCHPMGVGSIILFPVDLSQVALTAEKVKQCFFFPHIWLPLLELSHIYWFSWWIISSLTTLIFKQAIMSSLSDRFYQVNHAISCTNHLRMKKNKKTCPPTLQHELVFALCEIPCSVAAILEYK